ncbi:MAG: cytochrome c maturation protein CcmE [Alphaproteobacteria bacterium]
MTRKQQRTWFLVGGVGVLALATVLILSALGDSLVYFYSPTELTEKAIDPGAQIRVGGLVEEGSVEKGEGLDVSFVVTDLNESVTVNYNGLLPDLFREGQGVVAEGSFLTDGQFHATKVLAKHDEKYMPKEVADALKEQGKWKADETLIDDSVKKYGIDDSGTNKGYGE